VVLLLAVSLAWGLVPTSTRAKTPMPIANGLSTPGGLIEEAAERDSPPPAEPALWIHGHFGFAFADVILVDDLSLNGTEGFAPSVGIGVTYRLSRFDLGVLVEALGGGSFKGMSDTFRIGGQVRAAASFRWRFVHRGWGGLFLHLSPGWTMFSYSDAVRFQAAALTGQDLKEVEPVSHGFAAGFGVGLLVNLLYDVALRIGFEGIMASGSFAGVDSGPMMRVRGLASLGLEWGQRL